jgi:hypothetical protein
VPDGRVLVASQFNDGSTAVTPLAFGGSSPHTDTRQWTWESMSELQLFPASASRHRVKLTADSRLDGYRQDLASNQLGTFTFNSLADLAANRPSTFTRTLNAPIRTGGEWNGYLALGDLWRVSPNLQVMYGARVEGNAFTQGARLQPGRRKRLRGGADRRGAELVPREPAPRLHAESTQGARARHRARYAVASASFGICSTPRYCRRRRSRPVCRPA